MRDVTFVGSAAELDQVPPGDLPEIAFVGPSNVGKSTLINALTGRDGLARTSKTPGRTQLLNFFRVDGRFHLVDLPGYGFARVARDVQERFLRVTEEYLERAERLVLVLLLVDSRRGLAERDLELAQWLGERVSVAVVLTKADKLSRAELARQLAAARGRLPDAPVLAFSKTSPEGRKEIWRLVGDAVATAGRPRRGA